MSKLLSRSGPISLKPGAPQPPPTRSAPASKGASGTSEGVPEGASSTALHYTSASKVAAASARGAATSEASWFSLSGLSPPGSSLRPPSCQGSTVSMGSSGCTTLVQPLAPAPPVITSPTPAGPAAPPSGPSSMDVDMPELLGYKPDSIDHVFLGGRADSLNQDFKAATTSLNPITDFLNWMTVNQCTIAPSLADDICGHLIPLIDTVRDLRLFKRYLSRDSEEGTRHSSVGSSLSRLISTPGIAVFTTVPEALQAAKDKPAAPSSAGNKTKPKLAFRPGRVPSNTAHPPPVPHSTRPPRPTPSKLASARAENNT